MKAWTVPPSHSQHSLVTQIYHQQNILGAQTLKNWTSSISVEIGQVYIYIYITQSRDWVSYVPKNLSISPSNSAKTKELSAQQLGQPKACRKKHRSIWRGFFLSFLHHSPEISIIVMLLITSHPKKRGESQAKALAKASSARKTRTSSPKGRTNLER